MITENDTFNVVGSRSTGAFAGASGSGAGHLHVTAYTSRYMSGILDRSFLDRAVPW